MRIILLFVGGHDYDDHQNMVGATSQIKHELIAQCQRAIVRLTEDAETLDRQVNNLTTSCAVKYGINQTLERQNRDEQILIAGCQSEALKHLTPDPEKHTPVAFDVDNSNPITQKAAGLYLLNRSVDSVLMTVTCETEYPEWKPQSWEDHQCKE